jgi:hypothetical protein
MKKVIYAVSAALVIAWIPQSVDGQQESVLQHVAEVHVKPGQEQLFEAAHAARNERLAAAGVTFLFRSAVTEALVYRFVTPVGDYEGLARRGEEMSEVAARAPGQPNGNEAIDHVDSYLRWTRPDLGYQPEAPRLETADWQAFQRVRIYVKQGMMGEVFDVFGDVRDLYERNDVPERYTVSLQSLGSDGPIVEVQLFGSSMADIYQVGMELEESMGAEMNSLRLRLGPLARRIEVDNLMIRRDMGYQPPN